MRKAFASGEVFATTHGDQPFRVLAFPGWMRTVDDFGATLAGLPPGAGAVAVDLPGFGGVNGEPRGVWGAAEYAAWAAPVVDDLATDAGPLVLLGHSRGGAVALLLAAARPDRVAALVLTGAPLLRRQGAAGRSSPPLAFRVARALHRRGLLPDERMEALRQRYGSADYRAARGVMRDILVKVTNESYEDALARVRAPVELVWGANDTDVPVEVAERVVDILGPDRARLTVLDGVGHHTPLQAPDALRAAIERHLA